jgi:hypothetical protein
LYKAEEVRLDVYFSFCFLQTSSHGRRLMLRADGGWMMSLSAVAEYNNNKNNIVTNPEEILFFFVVVVTIVDRAVYP